MNRIRSKNKYKEKFKIGKSTSSTMSPDDQIRAIANLIIDRIQEESQIWKMK